MRGDPRRGKDIFWVFKVEGRETHKFWESQSREKRNQYSAWVWRGMGRDILGGNIEGNSHSVGPWGIKPINFGSLKAEGSETNTVFGYRG